MKHFFRQLKDVDVNQFKSVQEALADLVPKRGSSNADVGRQLGKVSGQLIGQYIAGRQKPKADFFKKWKTAFNEDLEAMIETNVSQKDEDSSLTTDNLKLSVKDYINKIENNEAFLQRLLEGQLQQINANLNLAVAGLHKITLDTDSMRTVALESLNRLEKKPEGELLKEADKIIYDSIQAGERQDTDS